jgi:hypothetical protein
MKKYMKIIEYLSVILMFIGCIGHRFLHLNWAIWVCIAGLALWLIQVIYKAFNWKEYAKDNSQNIIGILVVIIMLFIVMISIK